MRNKNLVKSIVDNFLVKKEGKKILKGIEKKNLLNEGIIDSLDVFTLASLIEKKAKRKLNISNDKIFKKFQKYKELTNL
jgi:acyl carrier protein|tara:strand:- start:184 stop:420 length:237 start_codon:yes stop_codon:yes gene_type:complete